MSTGCQLEDGALIVAAAGSHAIQIALRIDGQPAEKPSGHRVQNFEFGLRGGCRSERHQ